LPVALTDPPLDTSPYPSTRKVPPFAWNAVEAAVAVEANAPLAVTLPNVGPQVVQIVCGRESVTAPVDADAVISFVVPAIDVTPVFEIVRPVIPIPVLATSVSAPVLLSRLVTPVLLTVIVLAPPDPTLIPVPPEEMVIADPVWLLILLIPPTVAKFTVPHVLVVLFQYQ
jgi:hypothetical protein